MSINTHEDAFCLHKSVVLRQELSCKMNTGAHQECSGRISKVVSDRLKTDVHCKKAHFLMSFDRLVLFLFFFLIFQANRQIFIIKYHKLEFGP